MPSFEHEYKTEEIKRELLSRGMNWRARKQYPIWLEDENSWGLIDVVGFKKKEKDSPAEVHAFEIEEKSPTEQQGRNFSKLEKFKNFFPAHIKVHTCQLRTNEDHRLVCPRSNRSQIITKPNVLRNNNL